MRVFIECCAYVQKWAGAHFLPIPPIRWARSCPPTKKRSTRHLEIEGCLILVSCLPPSLPPSSKKVPREFVTRRKCAAKGKTKKEKKELESEVEEGEGQEEEEEDRRTRRVCARVPKISGAKKNRKERNRKQLRWKEGERGRRKGGFTAAPICLHPRAQTRNKDRGGGKRKGGGGGRGG